MTIKVVRVEWVDSATTQGWTNSDQGVAKIVSVGLLVRRTETEIVLSTSTDDDGKFIDPLVIPAGAIVKVQTLLREEATHGNKR